MVSRRGCRWLCSRSRKDRHDSSRYRWVRIHRCPRRPCAPSSRRTRCRRRRSELRKARPHRRRAVVWHGYRRAGRRRPPRRDPRRRRRRFRHPLRRAQAGRRIRREAAVVLPAEHQRHAQRAHRHDPVQERQEARLLVLRRHLRRAAGRRGARGRRPYAADQPLRPDQAVRRVDGRACEQPFGIRFCALRYFNVAGCGPVELENPRSSISSRCCSTA